MEAALVLFIAFLVLLETVNAELQSSNCAPNVIVNVTELIRSNRTVKIDAVHFTHIMKCGGSSVDDMLWRSHLSHHFVLVSTEAATTLPGDIFGSRASKYDIILPAKRNIKTKSQLNPENNVGNYQNTTRCNTKLHHKLVLVIIRDPIDRLISHFNQVRPWGNHTGADRACTVAASKGFRSFLNACKFSKDFMSSYHNKRIMEVLPQYSIVIPFEHYNAGLVLLHMYCGFTVENILYVVKKNYTQMPKVQISDDDIKVAIERNKKDFELYHAAQERWNRTIADSLIAGESQRLQRNLEAFKNLLNDFHNAYVQDVGHHINAVVSIPPRKKGGIGSQVTCTSENVLRIRQCRIHSEVEFTKTFCKNNTKCYNNNLIM